MFFGHWQSLRERTKCCCRSVSSNCFNFFLPSPLTMWGAVAGVLEISFNHHQVYLLLNLSIYCKWECHLCVDLGNFVCVSCLVPFFFGLAIWIDTPVRIHILPVNQLLAISIENSQPRESLWMISALNSTIMWFGATRKLQMKRHNNECRNCL